MNTGPCLPRWDPVPVDVSPVRSSARSRDGARIGTPASAGVVGEPGASNETLPIVRIDRFRWGQDKRAKRPHPGRIRLACSDGATGGRRKGLWALACRVGQGMVGVLDPGPGRGTSCAGSWL